MISARTFKQPVKIPRGPLLLMLGFAALLALLAGWYYGQFEYRELCGTCGRARWCVDWQIPATRHTYYSTRVERETPLSGTLESLKLLPAHEHDWLFVSGRGNGIYLLLGEGHPISWSLHSRNTGEFVKDILKWTDRDSVNLWLNRMRDPNYSRMCQALANASRLETFTNRVQWETWIADYQSLHKQMMGGPEEGQ